MLAILCGGGPVTKNIQAYELFANHVDKNKAVLCIPLAKAKEEYASTFGKRCEMLADFGINSAILCDDANKICKYDFSQIGGIYVEGGNTFRLMKLLRDSGAVSIISDYLKNGGVYIGSSAGAIIAGADIAPIIYMDSNSVLLKDTRGLNLINGYSTIAHYNDSTVPSLNQERNNSVALLAQNYNKLIALSEETAIVVESNRAYILGADCLVYENNIPKTVYSGENLYTL